MKSSNHTDEIHKLQRSGIGNTEWMKHIQVNMMNQKISISLNRYINTILDGYNNSRLIGEGHPRPYNDFQLPPTLIAKSKDEIKRIVTTIFNSKYEKYINLLDKSSNPDIFFTKENLTGGQKSIYHYTIPKFIRL